MIAAILVAVVVIVLAVRRAWRFGRWIERYRDGQRKTYGGDR